MKFTITHRNKKNQLLVSTKSLERFLGRIVNDDARNTVENFREYVPYLMNGYDGYCFEKVLDALCDMTKRVNHTQPAEIAL